MKKLILTLMAVFLLACQSAGENKFPGNHTEEEENVLFFSTVMINKTNGFILATDFLEKGEETSVAIGIPRGVRAEEIRGYINNTVNDIERIFKLIKWTREDGIYVCVLVIENAHPLYIAYDPSNKILLISSDTE